jgi:DHA1 family bicyclomycin/chloramphenicol resistance-like MFS transporter
VYSALILVMGVSPMVAPLLGAYVLVRLGWKAIFLSVMLAAILAMAGIFFRLPETLPSERPFSMGYILSTYRGLLVDRFFLGSALATGFSSAGMFAYIAGAPFVFINIFGLTAQHFGWLFALNASAVILSAQVNGRIFHGHAPERLMRNAAFVQCVAGVLLIGAELSGATHMVWLALPLFLYLSCIGFVFPNAVALALANHGNIAGMASALLGTLQFSMAAIATLALGAINSATALPMSVAICACGVMGVITHLVLVGEHP